MSMERNRIFAVTAGTISDHWRSNCFLKIDTESDKTRSVGNLFQYVTTRSEKAPLLAVIERCTLVARLGVGGGRSQTGYGQLRLWKFWRPGWGQLGSVCVPERRGWVGEAFFHMAREPSLAVLQGIGPFPVGFYQPSLYALRKTCGISRCLPRRVPATLKIR